MKPLSRRTFLRGAGALIGLPALEAMRPSIARAQAAPPPRRLLVWYVPNGIHMPAWTPATTGGDYTLPPILAPLAPVKAKINVLTGLANIPARPDGPGDHAAGTGSFLTATHVFKTEGADIHNGISMDQVASAQLGALTRFRSLELGAEGGGSTGGCDSGYSCAYARNISWAGPRTPIAKEVNPQAVFDRLFAGADPQASVEEARRRKRLRQSVLDHAREDASRLKARLGRSDNAKLDEYLTGVRELETRVMAAEEPRGCMTGGRPAASSEVRERVRAMSDLTVLAFQCDLTRVVTFMLGNAGSNRVYGFLGIGDGHHQISHHQDDPAKHRQLVTIATWEIEQLAYLLTKLDAVREPDGTLLDNSLVLFSSEIEDGNAHRHTNLPVILAGKGGGAVRPGRHIRYEGGPPIADLFISMLASVGVAQPTFGDDGTGPLPMLT